MPVVGNHVRTKYYDRMKSVAMIGDRLERVSQITGVNYVGIPTDLVDQVKSRKEGKEGTEG